MIADVIILSMSNNTFINVSAQYKGQLIYISASNGANATIETSTLICNSTSSISMFSRIVSMLKERRSSTSGIAIYIIANSNSTIVS